MHETTELKSVKMNNLITGMSDNSANYNPFGSGGGVIVSEEDGGEDEFDDGISYQTVVAPQFGMGTVKIADDD